MLKLSDKVSYTDQSSGSCISEPKMPQLHTLVAILHISQDTKCLTVGPSSAMADLSSAFGVIARERPTLLLQ